jgi:hypothetical protein
MKIAGLNPSIFFSQKKRDDPDVQAERARANERGCIGHSRDLSSSCRRKMPGSARIFRPSRLLERHSAL